MGFRLFYLSTNEIWSGSEVLWFESALLHLQGGYDVSIAVKYRHAKTEGIKKNLKSFIDLSKRTSSLNKFQRLVNRLVPVYKTKDLLTEHLRNFPPELVIISQGDNLASADMMELCIQVGIPFVTITQLVSEAHWMWLTGELQARLKTCYQQSAGNYFVSAANLVLHEAMMAEKSANSALLNNPVTLNQSAAVPYPSGENYTIAFVGRLECFHKGIDLLLQVVAKDKWKQRPVVFNLYGEGPHGDIIKEQLRFYNISNVKLHGFATDLAEVWRANQLAILPSRMEGQSLALLEALYCNRAAICTRVGAAAELIEDDVSGFLALYANTSQLDVAMERAWERRNDWEAMGFVAGNKARELKAHEAIIDFNHAIETLLKTKKQGYL